ncbi:ABC transporter ATP-binding protein [Phaeobacter gallaeciensis]|uniref:ABC transporter ATP-binding protein n=2 Tax=Roseobacteraceae TaxID=2854170 RepID=A0A366XBD8_9RHOB|nr:MULTISPECIES: ABC transporter ATP-binding protein [Roseobacteraceae]MBT3140551.1 ABC transporter ATP-binding protein [Falsiruegeria litorea]MBT8169746.1 ABC transporter ATP-binding protein [Falsiruegeria litorea]RBW62277.1 ABC transporter ATP-binding protein [Phaeobacter gallaeciensis]
MSEPILKIRNIESFYGPIMAIRGVSLDVHPGRIVSILGANGAGKTTLMKTVSGVMDPEKGTIEFDGRQIQGSEPHKVVQQGIVHVPEGREVFPLLTVDENLSLGAYTSNDKAQIERDRELVFNYFPILKERRNQESGTLSGGQQQMLAIGRGLMANPKIMLLDEPSLGLSPLLVQEIFEILKRLNEEQNMTMMLVEQNASAALNLAHDGYVMEVGRIVMDGTAAALMASEDIQNFYLGVQEEGARETRRWKRKKTWR